MAALTQDIKYGLRQLRRNPGFTAVAVITLALGIGANTAIFSAINVVLVRMLPVSRPEELVYLRWESPHNVTEYLPYPMFDRLRKDNDVLTGMFGFHSLRLATNLDGKPGLAAGQLVSGNYFSVLGVRTIFGRPFTADEDRVPGAEPFAVISYGYWKRQFGLDPAVVGKSIVLNGVSFTIIGVTPPDFFGVTVGDSRDIWIPLVMQAAVMDGKSMLSDSKSWWLEVMARGKPGISAQQATAALNVLYQRIARQQAGTEFSTEVEHELTRETIALLPASKGLSDLRSRFSEPLLILMVLGGILLLIACANIASVALARATARQKEMAVRVVLGAGQVHPVARDARVFAGEIADHFRVAAGFRQEAKGWGSLEGLNETSGFSKGERPAKHGAMRCDTQKFVNSGPRHKPRFSGRHPLIQNGTHPLLFGEVFVHCINQQVGVNHKHNQLFFLIPYSRASRSVSSTRYSSSRSAMFTRGGPILKLGRRNGRLGFGFSRSPRTRNSVTRAERVSLRSTARCFNSRKTGSGMIRVVFIWKTI